MNLFDVIIVVLAITYAISGVRAGFMMNLVEGAGLLLGGAIGVVAVPRIFGNREPSALTAVFALLIVVIIATVGQVLGHWIGHGLRAKDGPLRRVDAVAGGVLGMVTVLVAVWAVGYAATSANLPWLSRQVASSSILSKVNGVMPQPATDAMNAFNRTLSQNVFPRYLDPFQREVITEVAAPDQATLRRPEVVAARRSVVKIAGNANCGHGVEGSGFVYSRGRVMTNAHVVAGVAEPSVYYGGRRWAASTVLFDPELDIAVLRVDGLPLSPLAFDTGGEAGASAAVLGFPQDGPFDARAARIRTLLNLRSADIHGNGKVVRQAFSVRSLVRSGNSGGPLVSAAGKVYGVVFAASLTSDDTGYALTAAQVRQDARRGVSAGRTVSTGECA